MYFYKALGETLGAPAITDVNIVSRTPETIWPVVLGAHRRSWYKMGPPIAAPVHDKADAVATANASQASLGVWVDSADLDARRKFVVVSGLTACVGLVAGRWHGNGFTAAVVAHFNGDYDNAKAWAKIQAGLTHGGGPISATIVMTSDSSRFHVTTFTPRFERHLIELGVSPERILLYRSNTSGVAFLLDGGGFIGEANKVDFDY